MKTFSYVLVVVGMMVALGGVVAVFNFDQPADALSSAWWMIIGGWCMAFTGMGMDVLRLFKVSKREPAYASQTQLKRAPRGESEITRI